MARHQRESAMRIDTTDITARVYAKNLSKSILYVSVSVPSLQMWIAHCTVRPSTKYDDLWFQLPQFWIGKSWASPIEFRGDSAFLDLIRDETMRAVDQHIRDNKLEALFKGSNRTRSINEVHDVA